MACTATATETVADEIASRFGMLDPLHVRSGFDRPNLSFDVVAAGGQGLEGAAPGAARGRPRRPGEPAGDRLLRHPQGHRRGRGRAARRRRPRRGPLPRRDGGRRSATPPQAPVHGRRASRRSSPPTPSAWGSTRPTCARSGTWRSRPASRPITRRPGRAGRDGRPAKAVLLAMRADLGRLVRFNEQRSPDQEIARERGWRAYRVIKSFIYSDRCRRRQLLDHFSDRTAGAAPRPLLRRLRPRALATRPRDRRDRGRAALEPILPRPGRALRRRRAPLRGAAGLAARGRRGQARLHRRPQQDARRDRRRARPRTPPAWKRSAASARASSPSTRRTCWRSSPPIRPRRPG